MSQELEAYSPHGERHHPQQERHAVRWLLIKGLARQCGHWHEFPSRLAAATGARVECLDLPGIGAARDRHCPASVTEIVDDVRSRWAGPGPNGSHDFIFGLSLGGMVALDWVARFPKDFAGCVLVNTSARGVARRFERLRPAALWTFAQLVATRSLRERERLILKLCTAGTPLIIERYLDERIELGRRSPVRLKTFAAQLFAAARFRAPEGIEVPALVLVGQKDRLADPRCSRRLATRLRADLRMHPYAGHEVTLEYDDWVGEQVTNWVRARGLDATAR